MAVQKQKRNFAYKGQTPEETEEKAGLVPEIETRKQTRSLRREAFDEEAAPDTPYSTFENGALHRETSDDGAAPDILYPTHANGALRGNTPNEGDAEYSGSARGEGDRIHNRSVRMHGQETGNSREQEHIFQRMPENAAAEQVIHREPGRNFTDRSFTDRSFSTERNTGEYIDSDAEDPDRVTSSGRLFHKERAAFYHSGYQTETEDASAESRYTARHETRMFSKNARRKAGESASDTEDASQQTGKTRREARREGQKARESMKEAQKSINEVRKTAAEAGKTAGEAAFDTIDSITMYSELVTRPFETGKRTFSTGKETFSKEFGSVKEVVSSAKAADEAIGSKAKEMLKAMAVRTFRELAMLPIKLAKAAIKTVNLVLTTIATSGLNLLIMLIAVLLAAAVLVSIILFAAFLLIRYGGFWASLSF